MSVHQISFRLDTDIKYEAAVLECLAQYPERSIHRAAKSIVITFSQQGLSHPGTNPLVAQNHYQNGGGSQNYSHPDAAQQQHIETLGNIEVDFSQL